MQYSVAFLFLFFFVRSFYLVSASLRMNLGVRTVPYGLLRECPTRCHPEKMLNRVAVTDNERDILLFQFATRASTSRVRVITRCL